MLIITNVLHTKEIHAAFKFKNNASFNYINKNITLTDKQNFKRAINKNIYCSTIAIKPKYNKIYMITIKGINHIIANNLIFTLKSKPNSYINYQHIKQDIKTIYKIPLVNNIHVIKSYYNNHSIILIFDVIINPILHKIKINGNSFINNNTYKILTKITHNQHINENNIFKALNIIKHKYFHHGFYLINIKYKLLLVKTSLLNQHTSYNNQHKYINIIIKIKEHSPITIKTISFIGNHFLSSTSLKKHIQTQTNTIFTRFNKYNTYNKINIENYLTFIQQLYQQNGYCNIIIHTPRIILTYDKTNIIIIINIQEGYQYKLQYLKFLHHNSNIQKQTYDIKYKLFKFHYIKHKIFNNINFNKMINKMFIYFKNQGYAYINIIPKIYLNNTNKTINIIIYINKGPKIYIKKINIYGNKITLDNIIRKEITIFPGTTYSPYNIIKSKNNIMNMKFFHNVNIYHTPTLNLKNITLNINVKEKPTRGKIQLNISLDHIDQGILLKSIISKTNIFGLGNNISSQFTLSKKIKIFNIDIKDNFICNLYNNPLFISISLYNTKQNLINNMKYKTGGNIQFIYKINFLFNNHNSYQTHNQLKLNIAYNINKINFIHYNQNNNLLTTLNNKNIYITSLKTILTFNNIKTKSLIINIHAELASSSLGSKMLVNLKNNKTYHLNYSTSNFSNSNNIHYSNFLELISTIHLSLPIKHMTSTFVLNIKYLNLLTNCNFKKYLIGGNNTIRGYAKHSINIIKQIHKINANHTTKYIYEGGNKQINGTIELKFNILKKIQCNGIIFLDFGNVFDMTENLFYYGNTHYIHTQQYDPINFYTYLKMYASIGLEIQLYSPIGILKFICGIPLTPRLPNHPNHPSGDSPISFTFNYE